MQIINCCPFWGCEQNEAIVFMHKAIASCYEGVEIHFPSDKYFVEQFIRQIENSKQKNDAFIFIAQQLTAPENESVGSYIRKMEKKIT